jgi:hypothetical protein
LNQFFFYFLNVNITTSKSLSTEFLMDQIISIQFR